MGKKVQPHFLIESFKSDGEGNRYTTYKFKTNVQDDVSSQADAFKQIKAGMRACVTRTDGTSHTYWSEKPYAVYCKTGTAENMMVIQMLTTQTIYKLVIFQQQKIVNH